MQKNVAAGRGQRKNGLFAVGNIKFWAFLVCFLAAWLVGTGIRQAKAAALQRGISREVLRFHVLANSDREADQQVKLKVRDEVLEWLEGQASCYNPFLGIR